MTKSGRATLSRIAIGLWLPVLLAALGWLLPLGADFFENSTRDWFFARQRDSPALKTVAVVGFDDKTLEHFNEAKLNHRFHAKLVDRLSACGVRAIAFDFAFLSEAKEDPEQHRIFAEACRRSGKVVIGTILADAAPDAVVERMREPIAPLVAASDGRGVLFHPLDTDSVIRRATLWFGSASRATYALALQAYLTAEEVSADDVSVLPSAIEIVYGRQKQTIPLQGGRNMLIWSAGAAGTVDSYSYVDVLEGRVPEGALADRVVFVGPTATIFQDIRLVPAYSQATGTANSMTGVEIHAHTYLTIAEGLAPGGNFFRALPSWAGVALMVLCGLLTALSTSALDVRVSVLAPIVWSLLYVLLAYWYLVLGLQVLPPMSGPILSIVAVYLAVIVSLYLEERRGRLQVRHVFQHYVPSHVIERLERDPGLLQAPGQKQVLTILFSDIRSFTTLAERIGPEATVSLLNHYFEAMTQVILACDGKIDKFIGDAILAVFGEPVSMGNHAAQALQAGIGMRRALRELNDDPDFRAILQSDEALDIGIGINTGEVIVGNLGAAQRKDYTVIGDAVNLCSRLEGLAKGDNPRLILSEATYELTKGQVEVVSLGEVLVKGKTEPVNVFGVVEHGEERAA